MRAVLKGGHFDGKTIELKGPTRPLVNMPVLNPDWRLGSSEPAFHPQTYVSTGEWTADGALIMAFDSDIRIT